MFCCSITQKALTDTKILLNSEPSVPPKTAWVLALERMKYLFCAGSNGLGLFNGLIILVGTALSLAYFQFNVRSPRPAWAAAVGTLGQSVIALALGVVFAGVYMAALSALIGRLSALIEFVRWFFLPAA